MTDNQIFFDNGIFPRIQINDLDLYEFARKQSEQNDEDRDEVATNPVESAT